MVSSGDRIPVKILRIHPDRQRIGLSRRQSDEIIGQALLETEAESYESRAAEESEAPVGEAEASVGEMEASPSEPEASVGEPEAPPSEPEASAVEPETHAPAEEMVDSVSEEGTVADSASAPAVGEVAAEEEPSVEAALDETEERP